MKVPKWFQKLYWWGDSSFVELETHKRFIVVQVINHGIWEQWQWLFRTYGKERIRHIVLEIPASEFRATALKVLMLLLGIKRIKYASRSDYIKAKRNS